KVSVHDRGIEAGDWNLRKRPGMDQDAAAAGRAHDRAGKVACHGIESDRVHDAWHRMNGANGVSDIDGQTERSQWAGAHKSMWATNEFQSRRLIRASGDCGFRVSCWCARCGAYWQSL